MRENSVDAWDAFLNTLENRGVSSSWKVAQEVQEELINYFKTKIDVGVVNKKTDLPSDIIWQISIKHWEILKMHKQFLKTG